MASERHKAIISSASTFFNNRGCEVTTELLSLNGRNVMPDLIIQHTDGSILPFECGDIQLGLPHLYLLHFGGYYHANKIGRLNIITLGNSRYLGCLQCTRTRRPLLHPGVIKNFKSIRGTIGYQQYGKDFVKEVKRVRNAYPQKGPAEVFIIALDNCNIISAWLNERSGGDEFPITYYKKLLFPKGELIFRRLQRLRVTSGITKKLLNFSCVTPFVTCNLTTCAEAKLLRLTKNVNASIY